MTFLSRLRHSPGLSADAKDPSDPPASAEAQLPFPGYDHLSEREIVKTLSDHPQVELTAVDTYERSHKGREAVFNKLRYLRRKEPVAGYDALSVDQILSVVDSADKATLERVRSYEQKFANRPAVLNPVLAAQREQRANQPKEPVPQYQPLSIQSRPVAGDGPPKEDT